MTCPFAKTHTTVKETTQPCTTAPKPAFPKEPVFLVPRYSRLANGYTVLYGLGDDKIAIPIEYLLLTAGDFKRWERKWDKHDWRSACLVDQKYYTQVRLTLEQRTRHATDSDP